VRHRRCVPLLFALTLPPLAQAAPAGSLSGAWIRALPPTQSMTAAYFDIRNSGDTPLTITGATVAGASSAEIHVTREEDGRTRMERLTTLTVAPGQTESLAPGGKHLMLFGLERMPSPGETRQLCVTLAPEGQLCTEALVSRDDPRDDPGENRHEDHSAHQ